jgi:hypothetical protein
MEVSFLMIDANESILWLHHVYTNQQLKSYASSMGRVLNGTSVNMLILSAVIELPNLARCHLFFFK